MQIVGGGAILFIILKGQLTFGQGMLLTAVVFTLYNAMGGFVATAYTNLIHIAAIFLGIFLGGSYVILHTGALSQMAGQGHYFTPFGDMGFPGTDVVVYQSHTGRAGPARHQHGRFGAEHPRGPQGHPHRQPPGDTGRHHGGALRHRGEIQIPGHSLAGRLAVATGNRSALDRRLLPDQHVGSAHEFRLALLMGRPPWQ